MKEKSSTLFAEHVSGGGGPSVPSVDSRSVLERSTLVLRCSLEKSCWSPAEVASVWEDSEDRRLLEGCFRADVALLSGDGDSGAKLRERKGGRAEWPVKAVTESRVRVCCVHQETGANHPSRRTILDTARYSSWCR